MEDKSMQNQMQYYNYLNGYSDSLAENIINAKELQILKDYEKFKNKLKVFRDVDSISTARTLVKNMFQINDEVIYLQAGDGYCTIINQANFFNITLKNKNEIISYGITKTRRA